MLNKKIKIQCLKIGYIYDDAYYKDLVDLFKEHLLLIDDVNFTGKQLEITVDIKVVKSGK